ncbi:hypothetical protein ASC94_18950 [Massilia sp. Root418]|uniref:hypothetical protein n=1 Tax=Massilia sp. Root418 TaxID=1736532 RepID=UPI0006FCB06A|nr:hypothetical protein [Massilia sp. Root418]KQW89852.1 hypothetical protein ASC94_18950 [Massilia sp. Root418]
MTMPIRIDTLKYAQLLKESGLPAEQAELQAEALGTVLNECQVAVESDLVIQRSELLARMDLLKQEMFGQLDLLKQEMLARMDLLKQEIHTRFGALERRVAGLETRFYLFFGIQFAVDAVILFKLFS